MLKRVLISISIIAGLSSVSSACLNRQTAMEQRAWWLNYADQTGVSIQVTDVDSFRRTSYEKQNIFWRTVEENTTGPLFSGNWSYVCILNSEDEVRTNTRAPRCSTVVKGSQIKVENLAVSESIGLAGSAMSLVYSTEADFSRKKEYEVEIPITQSWVDAGATDLELNLNIDGQIKTINFKPTNGEDVVYKYVWDGLDSSGQRVNAPRWLSVDIQPTPEVYPVDYRSFVQRIIGSFDAKVFGLGGWMLSGVHLYDWTTNTLLKGDGSIVENVEYGNRSQGPLVTVSDPYSSEVYLFDANGVHKETRDGLTDSLIYSIAYDSNGYISSVTDAYSNSLTIQRNGSGEPTSITGPFGHVTDLTLNKHGRLSEVEDPLNQKHELTYHNYGRGLLKTFKRPGAQVNTFVYNESGQLLSDTRTNGQSETFTPNFGVFDSTVTRTTEENRTVTYDLDNRNGYMNPNMATQYTGLDGVVRSHSETATQISDTFGEMVYTTHLNSNEYINTSRSVQKTSVSNGVETVDFTNTTTVEFHNNPYQALSCGQEPYSFRNLVNPLDPCSKPVEIDKIKKLTQTTTSPHGGNHFYQYDDVAKTTKLKTPEDRETLIQHHSTLPQISSINPPYAAQVDFTYNSDGQLSAVAQGVRDLTLNYDTEGNLTSVVNDLSQTVSYDYDDAGRLTKITYPNNDELTYGYDANGKITSITPPGRSAYQFVYDSATEFLDQLVPPTLSGITDPKTYYYFDDDGLVTSVQRPSGSTLTFSYMTNSHLLDTISDGTDSFDVTSYDTNGMPDEIVSNYDLKSTWLRDGVYLTSDKLYDNSATQSYGEVLFDYTNLRVTNIKIKNGAGTQVSDIAYTFDDDSLVTAAGSLSLTRNATSGLIESSSISNIDGTFAYNTFGEITSYEEEYNSTTKYSYSLTRDNLGRITSMTEDVLGTSTTYDYDYDSNGRLTEVKTNSVITSTSTYSTNSTRTSGQVAGVSFTAVYDGHDRLTDWNNLDFAYNDNGEMTSRTDTSTSDVTTYAWDAFGRLNSVTLPNTDVVTYKYDGLGRKAVVLLNGTHQYSLLYQDQYQPVAQMDSTGALVARFIWGSRMNVPEYMVKGSDTYRFVTDPRGSVRLVLKVSDGTVAQRIDYDEWGRVTNDTSPGFQPFGYAGGLYDHKTGLVEFGARHYDANIGRFLTKDPIGFAGGDTNLYRYVRNNPINLTDPTGLNPLLVPVAIGATIGGVAGAGSAYLAGGNLNQVITGGAIGATAGAASVVAGATGVVAAVVGGGVVGGTADIATQTLVGGRSLSNVNLTSVGLSTAIGSVSGGVGAAAGTRAFFRTPVVGGPVGLGGAIRTEQVTGSVVGGTIGGIGTVGAGQLCQ